MTTMTDTMSSLMANWKTAHDEMVIAAAPARENIQAAMAKLDAAQEPYIERISSLEAKIRPLALAHAATFKGDGVESRYRKGAYRVNYDWRAVDTVLGVLQDILPKTAETLEKARSSSTGKPSVKIVRVEDST